MVKNILILIELVGGNAMCEREQGETKLSTRRHYPPRVSDPSDPQYPQPIPVNTHTLCTGMGIWRVRVRVALE